MKKIIKTFILISIIVILSACTSAEGTLTINADRSVNFDIKLLVDDNFNETQYLNNINNYKLRDISVDRLSGENGYKISKKYYNLDEISTTSDIVIELTKYLEPDFDDKYLFKVEKGYLGNKYYANFNVNKYDINKLMSESKDSQSPQEFIKIVQDIFNNALNEHKNTKTETTYTSSKNTLSIDKSITYTITLDDKNNVAKLEASNSYYEFSIKEKTIEYADITEDNILIKDNKDDNKVSGNLKFIVKLPVKTITNNADTISEDGLTLTWIYNTDKDNKIEFSFKLENKTNYLTIIGVGLLIIVMFLILIYLFIRINDRKRKKIEKEPIYISDDIDIHDIDESDYNDNQDADVIENETETNISEEYSTDNVNVSDIINIDENK